MFPKSVVRSCPIIPVFFLTGCLTSVEPAQPADAGATETSASAGDPTMDTVDVDAITYMDDLSQHPGCTTTGLSYPAATIPGYRCAAKEYLPTSEDVTKPIVLLIHGNSSSPLDWEVCNKGTDPVTSGCVTDTTPMLSERLLSEGFHAFAVDMRIDQTNMLASDPVTNDAKTGNPAHNIDHGWAVPIVEHFIESVLAAYPTRHVSIVGFSLGPTVIRDSLRRLHRKGIDPFARVDDLVFCSGAHHGVSSFRTLCGDPSSPANITMRGTVACQMGDLVSFTETQFLTPLNGADGSYETPCSDGSTAYGQSGVCGGHTVKYTTIVMRDISEGTYQDEFVSQKSSALQGANNETIELTDQDVTGFFYNGIFKNHFGSIRSDAGLKLIVSALGG